MEAYGEWGVGAISVDLDKYISKTIVPEHDYILIAEFKIPVIISSSYTAKGDGYFDKSLYFISCTSIIVDDKPNKVKFDGLSFVSHLYPTNRLPNLDDLFMRALPKRTAQKSH